MVGLSSSYKANLKTVQIISGLIQLSLTQTSPSLCFLYSYLRNCLHPHHPIVLQIQSILTSPLYSRPCAPHCTAGGDCIPATGHLAASFVFHCHSHIVSSAFIIPATDLSWDTHPVLCQETTTDGATVCPTPE